MNKRLKEITFDEAFKLSQQKKKVYVIDLVPIKPVVKKFDNLTIADVLEENKYIYVVVEEA